MVELRWAAQPGTTAQQPTLQWRCREQDPWGRWTLWGEWKTVPFAVLPADQKGQQ